MAVVIMDGGMGHMLRRLGVQIAGAIGSQQRFAGVAVANIKQPQLVQQAHEEFMRAGATVITTNNYACVPSTWKLLNDTEMPHVADADVEHSTMVELISAAGQNAILAREAVHGPDGAQRCLIAGSVPPLRESYRADCVEDDASLREQYPMIVKAIAPHCDVLVCETMSCAREARVAAEAAVEWGGGRDVWVSWTLHEDDKGKLPSGETVEEAVEELAHISPQISTYLLNCTTPENVTRALPALRDAVPTGSRVGAYANGFNTVNMEAEHRLQGGEGEYRELSPKQYAEQVLAWEELGATLCGGCCGIFPEHIAAMATQLALRDAGTA